MPPSGLQHAECELEACESASLQPVRDLSVRKSYKGIGLFATARNGSTAVEMEGDIQQHAAVLGDIYAAVLAAVSCKPLPETLAFCCARAV